MADVAVIFSIASVFIGCCSNVVFLELLVKEDPGSGNLITFCQFVFISLCGFIFTSKCGTRRSHIRMREYLNLVVLFFSSSVLNNYAFALNIPMPLHMIFRAGSLITNMIMGIVILKRRYTLEKYLSVGMITAGIIIFTVVSGTNVEKSVGKSVVTTETTPVEDFFWWTVGIACLTTALFISARMGIYQEELYRDHGKYPFEALYYTHLIPLPWFATLFTNLSQHLKIATQSRPLFEFPITNYPVPCVVVYLIGNVLTQYLCISSVYLLSAECSSLTVTLVVTIRKFVSLVLTILYFGYKFSWYHWTGTVLVFVGTVIFTEIPKRLSESLKPSLVSEKKAK